MSAPERLRVFGEDLQDPSGNRSDWNHDIWNDFWSVNKRTVSYGVVFDFNLKFNKPEFKFRVSSEKSCDEYGADNPNWGEIGLNTEWTIKKASNNLKAPTGKELSVSVLFPSSGNEAKITIKEGYNNFAYDYTPPVQTAVFPDKLYLRGHVNGTGNGWDDTVSEMGTHDGKKWTFPGSLIKNGWDGNATFNFVGEKDGTKYCWKTTGNQPIISEYPFNSETKGGDYKVQQVSDWPGGNGWQVRVSDVATKTITLDFSGTTPKLIIAEPTVTAEVPNDLFIIGTVNGGTWDVSNPGSVKGVKNGNVFTFTNITLNQQSWGASFVFQTEPARTQNHPKAEEIYG